MMMKSKTKKSRQGVKAVTLADATRARKLVRRATGLPSLDEVLGGGLVRGATYLLYSDPGLGKTTLCLQVAGALARCGLSTIVASGEQEAVDVEAISRRLGHGFRERQHISVFGHEGDAYKVVELAARAKPALLVVDSLQTAFMDDVGGDVGSTSQLKALANYYTSFGKVEGVTVVLINHTLRDGMSAGPMEVEHLVDAKIRLSLFASEEFATLRKIEAEKYRYGASARGLFVFSERGYGDLGLVESVVTDLATDESPPASRRAVEHSKKRRPGAGGVAVKPKSPKPRGAPAAAVEVRES